MRVAASCVCANHVFMCDTQAFSSSGAEAAVSMFAVTRKCTHTSTKTPTAWISSSFFSRAAGRAASARYSPPPHLQEMPATASVCTKTNRCSGASETECVSCAHRQHILLQHATECAQTRRASAPTTRHLHAEKAQFGEQRTSSAAEESMASCLLVFASRESSCLSQLPWVGCLMQRGEAVCGVVHSARTRKRTRFHFLPVRL